MRKYIFFFAAMIVIFALDQIIKIYILDSVNLNSTLFHSRFINIVLVLNKGVAFSFLSFLGAYLKYLIVAIFLLMFFIILKSNEFLSEYSLALGAIFGAGASNLIDRFIHGGVIDYIFWHFGFNFAVFNLADSIINVCIVYIIAHQVFCKKIFKRN